MKSNDSRNKVKLPFGMKNGELRHISEVDSGLACGCRCAACDSRLVAKKGDQKTHHFAHYQDEECAHALETALHYAAKAVLQESLKIALPELVIMELVDGEVCGQKRTKSGQATVCDMVIKKIDRVELEKPLNRIIPDVIAYIDGQPVLIEIAVTHFVDLDKEKKIKDLNIDTIEIDLSDIDRSIYFDSLRDAVVESISNKKWVFNSSEKIASEQLRLKLQSELKGELDKIFLEDQEKKKIEEEQRRLRKAKQAKIRHLLNHCLEDAYRHIISNQQLESQYVQELQSQPLWLRSASLMDVSLETLPRFLNIPVKGEYIFACDRRVWQSGLFATFIFNKFKKYENPYPIRINAMTEWCSKYVPINKFAFELWSNKEILKPDEKELLNLFDYYNAVREFVRYLEKEGFLKYTYKGRYIILKDHWQAITPIEPIDTLIFIDSYDSSLTEEEWENFQERAGIHEFCGGKDRREAERLAYRSILSENKQNLLERHNGMTPWI